LTKLWKSDEVAQSISKIIVLLQALLSPTTRKPMTMMMMGYGVMVMGYGMMMMGYGI